MNGCSSTPTSCAPRSSVSIETPSHLVSNFDHLVTQWMSTVGVSCGSACSSYHDHRFEWPLPSLIVKSHVVSDVRGVGPADNTGKSRVSYCPGGSRPGGASGRRL